MYDEIRDELKEKQEELFSWKAQIEMSLAEAPKGKLYRSASNGYEQYYIREPDHNGRIRKKYVRKNERKRLAKIWQRDYDCKILSMIKKRIQCIDQFLEQFSVSCPEEVYEKLPLEQKKAVSPFVLTDEMYIKEWKSVIFEGMDMASNPQEIFTERGEQVRSKSEKIIADSLYRNGIPYRYEHPVYLRGMGVVHPDFICLHVKKRKEILWEHMGLMGDPEYCRRALKKEELYIKNGYRSGIDIIYTRESSGYTISTKVIDQIIKDTFL